MEWIGKWMGGYIVCLKRLNPKVYVTVIFHCFFFKEYISIIKIVQGIPNLYRSQYQLLLAIQWDRRQVSPHIPVSWAFSSLSLNLHHAGLFLSFSEKNTSCFLYRSVPSTLPMCDEYLVMMLEQLRGKTRDSTSRGEYA